MLIWQCTWFQKCRGSAAALMLVNKQTNKQKRRKKERRMSVDIFIFPAYICLSQAGLSHAKSLHNSYTDEWWPQHCLFCPLSPHALPDSQDIHTPSVGRTRTQWLELAFVLGREQLLHFILCFHTGEENQIHFTPQNRFTWSAFESKNVVKKQTCKWFLSFYIMLPWMRFSS